MLLFISFVIIIIIIIIIVIIIIIIICYLLIYCVLRNSKILFVMNLLHI